MTVPVNLNKARKARARAEAKARADENALSYGRSKSERAFEAARKHQARAHLDQYRVERDVDT